MATRSGLYIALYLLACLVHAGPIIQRDELPIVDLGYRVHRARSLDADVNTFTFSNIPYAQPPIGDLRFTRPQPPLQDRTSTSDGGANKICPQALPQWSFIAQQFVPLYLSDPAHFDPAEIQTTQPAPHQPDPRISEDCLQLDVVVPKTVWDERNSSSDAPVLVWIHGGGYVAGSKDAAGRPVGLIKNSARDSSQKPLIFVALNYRLGAFGFSSGTKFIDQGGVPNAGLLDQRLALNWVQQNIHLFGGNKDKVTVMGESAGGGSIEFHITAFGGANGPAPFSQAVLQSPAFVPVENDAAENGVYDRLLQLAGVDSLKELRSLPCDKIIAANAQQVAVDSSYSTFTYGPVVDHTYVGQLPGRALAQGMFDKNVKVLTGHNTNEGLSFTSPFIRDEAAFADYLKQTLAASEDRVISHITQQLYPPIYDGSKGYRDIYARISTTISESVFTCNTYHLHKALNGQSYSYIFNVPPALHGQDVPYTFYDESGKPSRDVPSQYTATVMQDYIVSFAQTGQPKSSFNVPEFEQYGSVGKTMRIDSKTVQKVSDDIVRARCDFWQQVTFA